MSGNAAIFIAHQSVFPGQDVGIDDVPARATLSNEPGRQIALGDRSIEKPPHLRSDDEQTGQSN